jgi:ATP-dependent DNA helicase RecG
MTREELKQLINDIDKRQSESDHVEVKAARGGTPKRLYEPLSAFANRTGGGVILFGLDEYSGFSIVGVGDAHKLQEEITHLASDQMEPALRPEFLVDEIEDETVVAVYRGRSSHLHIQWKC